VSLLALARNGGAAYRFRPTSAFYSTGVSQLSAALSANGHDAHFGHPLLDFRTHNVFPIIRTDISTQGLAVKRQNVTEIDADIYYDVCICY